MVTTELTDLEPSPEDQAHNACKVDLEAVFDRAAVGMEILDRSGRWVRVNQSLCDLLGYQRQDGIQRVARIVRAMKEFSHPGSEERRPLELFSAGAAVHVASIYPEEKSQHWMKDMTVVDYAS